MKRTPWISRCTLAIGIAFGVSSGPAFADPPEWAKGKGKGHNKEREAKHSHFRDDHRGYVRSYYEEEFRSGHCPPGLAKKRNGCMPPGQAKKWKMGRPLPAGVVVHEVPQLLVVKIGVPPPGYQYVRVASDILMIAVGTRMVMDAISDLGRL